MRPETVPIIGATGKPRSGCPYVLALMLALLAMLGSAAAVDASERMPNRTPACRALDTFAGRSVDAASAFRACLASLPSNADVPLRPGRYMLRSAVVVTVPVHLHTAGFPPGAVGCRKGRDPRCATFVIVPQAGTTTLPFAIATNGVHVDAIAFEGSKLVAPVAATRSCSDPAAKASGGGVRIQGDDLRIERSSFQAFPCYTSVEFEGGARTSFIHNVFAANGSHDASLRWSDGLTIHDGRQLDVSANLFIDNTDVQLIFGGCKGCRVTDNLFRHSGRPVGGSFAELMLHAWPHGATSGDFSGSHVTGNRINCSPARRCGFGLMIGATPWYRAVTFGGSVENNRVVDAMIGLNINDLTGPMVVMDNKVYRSGGEVMTTCGPRTVGAINVSPQSSAYIRPASTDLRREASTLSFDGCLANHPLAPARP